MCIPQQTIEIDALTTQLVGFYIAPDVGLDTYTIFEPFFTSGKSGSINLITDRFGNEMDSTGAIDPGPYSLSGGLELSTIKTFEAYELTIVSTSQQEIYPGVLIDPAMSLNGDSTYTFYKDFDNLFSPPLGLSSLHPVDVFAGLLSDRGLMVTDNDGKRFYFSTLSRDWYSEFGDLVIGEGYRVSVLSQATIDIS
jgi:hypothetical protein